ncbi:fibrinogen-like YCDxxxxGGGW domain-containing protein [Homoserinibacter sp. YIM 151385]|uniref:fibrinogen-like YCDxxxxGGGW domain-containing protein n=1 Tax=Homoserinibacter sp. YIM 151385 TaxID=2985506 RepID=UPI0022F0A346|nr:fibrinogen-like YCDxxxxGGGW domain-containing protein [Homoserinibacter sp. YIM 151385]WBU38829.1 fibrinogen-like YCDxxxxGGGW domain-containing protein [Homoserinibacter sp. YIM 151385]
MIPRTASPTRRLRSAALALTATAAVIGGLLAAPAAASAAPAPDGMTSQTAAASCWEIKQLNPAAPSGVYWLVTPALVAPQQFYCDQETEGGGWVLIARGRDGWKPQYQGLRTPAAIRNTPSGTGAFAVAQLPSRTVDALLDNRRVDSLTDGIRIRRARDAAGTAWQEVRFKYQSRDRWVWTFGAEHRVASYTFDGLTGSGGQTNSFGGDNAFRRVDTNAPQAQAYVGGLAYGASVTGTNSASTYLYSSTNGGGNARPFAQMMLRPRLMTADLAYPAIQDAGTTAIERTPLPESEAITTTWGVQGLANGRDSELSTEVQAFAQVGNTVFVGGNFRYVQRTEAGADRVEQRYLAAFDVDTGEFKPGFRPVLNEQVKALAALPDGRLAVGGAFTQVNGQARSPFVILDPATGATSTGWQLDVQHRNTGGVASVRGMSIEGDWLYLSGAFTHWVRPNGQAASAWNGGRVNVRTGVPDGSWNPLLNGTSVGVEAAKAGDRAYFSGYFKQSGQVFTPSGTAIQTTAGAPVVQPVWLPQFSKPGADYAGNIWQLGVAEAGGKVWLGGSEHSLFGYERQGFQRQTGFITKAGGDFQAVEASRDGGLVFGGCHCGDWVYSNAYTWDGVGTGWTQADKISLFGAWDTASGTYAQDFAPLMQARRGFGVWALFQDSRGTLWAGGDLSRSVRAGEANQWSGGFARFRARDTQAPTRPGSPAITASGAGATLSWGASSDDRAVTGYEVLRNDRVIGTTTARSFQVAEAVPSDRFFVRAVDAGQNRSASTTKLQLSAPDPEPEPDPEAVTLIETGSSWHWRFDSAAWPAGWNAAGFDASAWPEAPAVLGWGGAVGTDLTVGAPTPRPLSAQFVRTVQVEDAAELSGAKVTVRADDGVVVYVNGQEIGRRNLPAGTLTQNSYASAAPSFASAAANTAVFEIPAGVLVDGANTIAASTHLNYRSTPSVSFDLALTATRG